jgi:hypothetical protein
MDAVRFVPDIPEERPRNNLEVLRISTTGSIRPDTLACVFHQFCGQIQAVEMQMEL